MRMLIEVVPAATASAKAVLSERQKARLGSEGRIPVTLEVGGETFRTTVVRMHGRWCFVANAAMRAAGLTPGRRHGVEIARDDAPRVVTPPPELAVVLAAAPEARSAWESFSFSHQREWAEYVDEAKRPETRERRAAQVVAELRGRA